MLKYSSKDRENLSHVPGEKSNGLLFDKEEA